VTLILIYVVVFGGLMVFMTTRGRKRQAAQANAMQSALAIGAEVRTIGGLLGTVTDLTDEYVVVETTPGVKLKFTKQAIAGVVAPAEVETFGAESELESEVGEPAAEETPAAEEPEDAKDEQKV
jgi:preprotein translocase subunit YajC